MKGQSYRSNQNIGTRNSFISFINLHFLSCKLTSSPNPFTYSEKKIHKH